MTILVLAAGIVIASVLVAAFAAVPAVAEIRRAMAASRESVARLREAWQPVAEEQELIVASVGRLKAALADGERAVAALGEISRAKGSLSCIIRFTRTALRARRALVGGGGPALALTLAETLLQKGGREHE